jgi:glutamine amidotransferase-like uncharacterized protein
MTESAAKPDQVSPAKLTVTDVPHAPFIYFEGVSNFGHTHNVLNVTLAANRYLLTDGEPIAAPVAVAYLRCNVAAAVELRNAIDQALLLGAKTEGQAN